MSTNSWPVVTCGGTGIEGPLDPGRNRLRIVRGRLSAAVRDLARAAVFAGRGPEPFLAGARAKVGDRAELCGIIAFLDRDGGFLRLLSGLHGRAGTHAAIRGKRAN